MKYWKGYTKVVHGVISVEADSEAVAQARFEAGEYEDFENKENLEWDNLEWESD